MSTVMSESIDDHDDGAPPAELTCCQHVIRLGGSLLTLPDLASRLRCFLSEFSGQQIVLVVGGGAAADLIRRLHGQSWINDSAAHWQAIQAMTDNAAMLGRMMPEILVSSDVVGMQTAWHRQCIPALNAVRFLHRYEKPDLHQTLTRQALMPLPHSCTVTSDSIALWTARVLQCRSVWLLKSCDAFGQPSCAGRLQLTSEMVQNLTRAGRIDSYFSNLWMPEIVVSWQNLRSTI